MLWCIHCHDKPNSSEIRAATRDAHLNYLDGFAVAVAGPLLNPAGEMVGSLLMIEAPDRATAEAFAEGDPYAQAGLFETVSIAEFKKVFWPS